MEHRATDYQFMNKCAESQEGDRLENRKLEIGNRKKRGVASIPPLTMDEWSIFAYGSTV
jgi:hypothetical protein